MKEKTCNKKIINKHKTKKQSNIVNVTITKVKWNPNKMWSSILNNQQILSGLQPEEIPSIIVVNEIVFIVLFMSMYLICVNLFVTNNSVVLITMLCTIHLNILCTLYMYYSINKLLFNV